MKRVRLTMSQALVKFLDNQYIECDGVETKFVSGMFGIFGHGCVVGVGQALEQGGHNLKFYQGKNEQNEAPRPQKEPGNGGLGLLLILAITAIGVGYVGYRLSLVFGLI